MLRRSLRILRNSLTILSLALFAVVTLSWFDSYRHSTLLTIPRAGAISNLINERGRIELTDRVRYEYETEVPSSPFWRGAPSQNRDDPIGSLLKMLSPRVLREIPHGRFFGFGYFNLWRMMFMIVVPHWFLALFFAIPPTLKLRAILRARKQKHARGFEVIAANQATTPD